MCSIKKYTIIFVFILFTTIDSEILGKFKCADNQCSKPVAKAVTLLNYNAGEKGVLSFKSNEEVLVLGCAVDMALKMCRVKINGKIGYAPKEKFRETNKFGDPDVEVDVGTLQTESKVDISPQRVVQNHEVFSGTTIYPIDSGPDSLSGEINNKSGTTVTESNLDNPTINDKINQDTGQLKQTEVTEHHQKIDNNVDNSENTSKKPPYLSEEPLKNKLETAPHIQKVNTNVDSESSKTSTETVPTSDNATVLEKSPILEIAPVILVKVTDDSTNDTVPIPPATLQIDSEAKEVVRGKAEEETIPTSNNATVLEKSPIPEIASENLVKATDESTNDSVPTPPATLQIDSEAKEVVSDKGEKVKINQDSVQNGTENTNNEDIATNILQQIPNMNQSSLLSNNDNVNVASGDSNVETSTNTTEVKETLLNNNENPDVSHKTFGDSNVETSSNDAGLEAKEPQISTGDSNVDTTSSTMDLDVKETESEVVGEQIGSNSHFEKHLTKMMEDMKSQLDATVDRREDTMSNDPSTETLEESIKSSGILDSVLPPYLSGFLSTNTVDSKHNSDASQIASEELQAPLENISQSSSSNTDDILSDNSQAEANEPEVISSNETDGDKPEDAGSEENEIGETFVDTNTFLDDNTSPVSDSDSNNDDAALPNDSEPSEGQSSQYEYCDVSTTDCSESHNDVESKAVLDELFLLFSGCFNVQSEMLIYLVTTAVSVLLFLFGYLSLDKSKRVVPLIAKINKLEHDLLVVMKENEMLQENVVTHIENTGGIGEATGVNNNNEVVEQLTQRLAEMQLEKVALEDQIVSLEKELDTSTEVGMELNKIVSDMLSSNHNGSEVLRESVEQMKRQLIEQQDTITSVNDSLSITTTENHELRLDLDISNKKVTDLQTELDKMVNKIVRIEDERDQQQNVLEKELTDWRIKYGELLGQLEPLKLELQTLKSHLDKSQKDNTFQVKQYNELKSTMKQIKSLGNDKDNIKSLLEVTAVRAELGQLKVDASQWREQLRTEQETRTQLSENYRLLAEETQSLREKYEQADKGRLEIGTKLEVLNNYFKEKESLMQKEISKYESLWAAKEGEATSTTERIKHMQDELQNYKSLNESLKQEILSQEVDLKSQISVLEKKVHDNWVSNRQLERKLEESKQEAAQLRNLLTISERTLVENNTQMRMQSPLQNGELPLSPPPILPNPPPFLPPPPNAMPPFMPRLPHFMPPPPQHMFPPPPGDHRPPPLGRMSSPPPLPAQVMMDRYTPESTVYSGYDRNSPSPPYDSEYGASPPPLRGYSPYNSREDRREYKRPQIRNSNRNNKGSNHLSSGSGRSNDSTEEVYTKSSKKV